MGGFGVDPDVLTIEKVLALAGEDFEGKWYFGGGGGEIGV